MSTSASTSRGVSRGGAPANDDCANATPIANGSVRGDTTAATSDGQITCGGSSKSPDVWFKYVAPATGEVMFDFLDSNYAIVSSAHSACPGTPMNQLACNEEGPFSAIVLDLPMGSETYIRVGGWAKEVGSFTLQAGAPTGIAGSVGAEGSGDPIGASLGAYDDMGRLHRYAFAQGGSYFLPTLPGKLTVTTRNFSGFVDELYDDRPCTAGTDCDVTLGDQVPVKKGIVTSGIDFVLSPGGDITGTVTESGTGVPLSVRVDLWNASGDRVASISSGSLGDYFFATGLASGTYFVSASTSGAFVGQLYDGIRCSTACVVTTGTPIFVSAPNTTRAIDFALLPTSVFIDGFESGGTGAWSEESP